MNKEQVEFIARMSREFSDVNTFGIGVACLRLMALARKAKKNAEDLCSLPNAKDKDVQLCKAVEKVFAEYGFKPSWYQIGGDPRGYCLKLKLPSGHYNTWGGKEEGYGVPC